MEIEKKFQDKMGGVVVDTTWAPEEWATVRGVVVSAPAKVVDDPYRKVTQNVRADDQIFFSYAVIFDYINQPVDDTPIYKNLVVAGGREYWQVPLQEVFARRDQFGMWSMVTEMVMVKPDFEEYRGFILTRKREEQGEVMAMPVGEYDFGRGDRVYFEEKFVQKYNLGGQMYYLIPPRRIIAKD